MPNWLTVSQSILHLFWPMNRIFYLSRSTYFRPSVQTFVINYLCFLHIYTINYFSTLTRNYKISKQKMSSYMNNISLQDIQGSLNYLHMLNLQTHAKYLLIHLVSPFIYSLPSVANRWCGVLTPFFPQLKKIWQSTHNIKFTIIAILKYTVQWY